MPAAHDQSIKTLDENRPGWMCLNCSEFGEQAQAPSRCSGCGKPGLIGHPNLFGLSIAHIDCDAFYASVEKRDNPDLISKPVIIGGGQRGVVATACYIARIRGVRSAMPMFKALEACPDAVVIKPTMSKYAAVGSAIKEAMETLTPSVQSLSIDEAFLDLTGTEALHQRPVAIVLRDFQQKIAREFGLTVSVGLSMNKLMAKIASDLQKPRGFSVLGATDGPAFLAGQPIAILWGIGKVTVAKMNARGIYKVSDLLDYSREQLFERFGAWGERLYDYARGQDSRAVGDKPKSRSISNETTFTKDLSVEADLQAALWPLCEKLAERLKSKNLATYTLVLKLKDQNFKSVTRSHTLADPTASADRIFRTACQLLASELGQGKAYRLIGMGCSTFVSLDQADPLDLADPDSFQRQKIETALDQVRDKLGRDAPILRGRGL